MAGNNINMSLSLQARGFSDGIRRAQSSMSGLSKTAQTVGRTMQYALSAALLGAGADALKAGVDFELANRKLQALDAGQSTALQLSELSKTARGLGESSIFTAAEVANLQVSLKKLGLSSKDVNDLSGQLVKFATAMDTTAEVAGGAVVKNINRFNNVLDPTLTQQEKATKISREFANATVNSALGFETLNTSLSYAGPVAASLGFTFAETTAILGKLADAGFEGSKAGTVLRKILTSIAKEGGGITNVKEDLAGLIDDNTQFAEVLDIVGLRAVSGTLSLKGLGDEVKELTKKIEDGENIETLFEARGESIDGRIRNLRSAIQEIGIQILDTFGPKIRDAINSIIEFVKGIDEGDVKFGGFLVKLRVLTGLFGPLTNAVLGFASNMALAGTGIRIALGATGWIGALFIAIESISGAWNTAAGAVKDYQSQQNARAESAEVQMSAEELIASDQTAAQLEQQRADLLKDASPEGGYFGFDQDKFDTFYQGLKDGKFAIEDIVKANEKFIERNEAWSAFSDTTFREDFTNRVKAIEQLAALDAAIAKKKETESAATEAAAEAEAIRREELRIQLEKEEAYQRSVRLADEAAKAAIATAAAEKKRLEIEREIGREQFKQLQLKGLLLGLQGVESKPQPKVGDLISDLEEIDQPYTGKELSNLELIKENLLEIQNIAKGLGDTLSSALLDPTISFSDALKDALMNLVKLAIQWVIEIAALTGLIALGNALTGGGLSAFLKGTSGTTGVANGLASGQGMDSFGSLFGRSLDMRSSIAGNDLVIATGRGASINSRIYG